MGEFDTWGNSPSSAGLRPHGPWHTGEIRGTREVIGTDTDRSATYDFLLE